MLHTSGGGSSHTVLMDRVESKAFRLINCHSFTSCLVSLKSRRIVTSLSIFWRYFHAHCSSELADCMPSPFPWPRRTRFSSFARPYSIQTPYAKVNQYLQSFTPFTGQLWNRLSVTVFPPSCDLQYFKREVSLHLAPWFGLSFFIFFLFLEKGIWRAFLLSFLLCLSAVSCVVKKNVNVTDNAVVICNCNYIQLKDEVICNLNCSYKMEDILVDLH